jgi:translation initiation factor 1
MNQTHSNILFLSQNAEDGQQAKTLFTTEAQKAELAWTANSGLLSDLPSLQGQASLIIILENANEPPAVLSSNTIEVEHWRFSAPSEVSKTIEQNLGKLIVRLILKGGKRQPTTSHQHPTHNQQTAAKTAAKTAAVRVSLDSKGRGGKKVSVVSGVPLSESALEDLTTKLKRTCGSGGTLKDGQIEIQGDHRDKLMAELQKLGYKPKRSGG